MMTVICMLPIMGGLAIAVDYAEMTRERSQALSALDAAGIAAARVYLSGMSDADVKKYAEDFFKANSNGLDPSKVQLTLVLPKDNVGGGTLKLSAAMQYDPYFLPVLTSMLGKNAVTSVDFSETSEIRLKNTLEVALVLDNSGSMDFLGGSSTSKRIDLLKAAAKELVTTLAKGADQMKQVQLPVQFSLVPFASSVNIGPANETETWMDLDGVSPIHHENFDWATMNTANNKKRVDLVGGVYYKKGTDWGTKENQKVTRFTLYKDILRSYKTCTATNTNGSCKTWSALTTGPFAIWKGCVEARPSPYDVDDTIPSSGTPATLFVPMFAPDEADPIRSYNNWWTDVYSGTENNRRQKYMPKYFPASPPEIAAEGIRAHDKAIIGPNQSCTTNAITALTDVSVTAGKTKITTAIDAMQPLGATNVPEGMAWGWRTVSSGVPFTGGRPETEKGNDKVVIVVTDGANTYYTPDSLGDENGNAYSDSAGNRSIYSSLGYARMIVNTSWVGRIFQGTSSSISKTTFTNANYTAAMNEHFKSLCANAKAKKIMVMTVALDLDASKTAEKTQIDLLKACASDSRIGKEADGVTPKKLFWNSTGKSLEADFKAIGNELSNLRIVG